MAINVIKNQDGSYTITLKNGHAEALKKITSDYDIINEEKTLSFILSVMKDADGTPIKVKEGSFVPTESIKNQKKDDSLENAPIEKYEDAL